MAVCCPTCGAPAPAPTQPARNSVAIKPPARPQSFLVAEPTYHVDLTGYRETDVHTAMARGLAEYLAQQSVEIGGRKLSLTTYNTWAEPEANVAYPAAAIGAGPGLYDRNLTPNIVQTLTGQQRLVSVTEFSQELTIDLWATDPKERLYLVAMIEEALNPVEWMYGFRLVLPFYHGTTAVYELLTSQYQDSSDDAMANYRRAAFTVRGTTTAYRLLNFPDAQPVALRLGVSDSGSASALSLQVDVSG